MVQYSENNNQNQFDDHDRHQEFVFKNAMDHFYDGVFITDKEGKIIYVNEAYTKMAGLKYEDVVGQYVEELESKGIFKNSVSPEVRRQKKVVSSIGKSKNGVDMLITGKPILDKNNELIFVVVNQRDISDLELMRHALEITESKMAVVEKDRRKKEEEIEYYKRHFFHNTGIIGDSDEIRNVIQMINKIASLDTTITITGESGVGKEVIANEIFQKSPRSSKQFIKVNCAAIPLNLLESELFGYEKGAFTGADKTKKGFFQLANEGVIFLDEIGEIPLELQPKLLRAIQQKEVIPVGGTQVQKLDIRIIAATNRDLSQQIKEGKFREDLFYRLNVFPIDIPPLRERRKDIYALGEYFLKQYNEKYGKSVILSSDTYSLLMNYDWPGNVRELENIIERITIIFEDQTVINSDRIEKIMFPNTIINNTNSEKGLKDIVAEIERKLLIEAIKETGTTRKAAEKLKIDQSTVVKKAKKYGIIIDEIRHRSR
ncbi:sigma-54 interaction domain-containing protein [Psychrobacillus sp. NPDC093180]|uniref:sigma-54 interaction domain-containing protein n=1 Tax=Psychrobacillus sp. NPDC093180 TaxID=3364489 RepID=UPI00380A0B35